MKTKRNLIIAACFVTLLAFLGCERCATCTQTTTVTRNGVPVPAATTVTTIQACGSDIKAIDGMEVVSSTTSLGATYVSKCVTECENN